jgi:hypothetical protein
MKVKYNLVFCLIVSFLYFVLLTGVVIAGTTVTNEGIKFPDGTIQTTKATETGIPGPEGPQGPKGDTGLQGLKGDTGDTGLQGLKGDTGDTGLQGLKGDTGLQGLKGDTGDTGLSINWKGDWSNLSSYSVNDAVSYQGVSYIAIIESIDRLPTNTTYWDKMADKGDTGDTGLEGSKGDKGDTGDTGLQGPKGDTGDTGLSINWKGDWDSQVSYLVNDSVTYQGSSYIAIVDCLDRLPTNTTYWGKMTAKGDKGDTGDTGLQGLKGDTGDTGLQGLKGDKGDTGLQGLKGDKGDTGDTGLQGLKGDTGDTGPAGQSVKWKSGWSEIVVYVVNDAVSYLGSSYIATVESLNKVPTDSNYWNIMSIKGDKGDTGDTGLQGLKGDKGDTGEQGLKGDKGDTGEQGLKGDKGDTGDTGPVGPVAGSDKQFVYNDNGSAAGAGVYYDKSTGKVGIGVSSPPAKLSIQGGNVAVRVTEETGWKGWIYFQESYINNGPGIFYEGSASSNPIHIGWKGGEVKLLTILDAGNVGIGISTPSYKLHVNGSVAGTSWNNISSRDYKQNINIISENEYPIMLSKVMNMVPTTYEYKEEYGGDNTTKLGFIAEDMPEEVLSKNGKGVDLYELLTLTIGAMKAQQKQIEVLEHQIKELKIK